MFFLPAIAYVVGVTNTLLDRDLRLPAECLVLVSKWTNRESPSQPRSPPVVQCGTPFESGVTTLTKGWVAEIVCAMFGNPVLLKFTKVVLDPVTGLRRVVVEHLDRIERILVEILADQRQFLERVVGHGDDVATDLIRVENVQEFAGAGPDQLDLSVRRQHLHRRGHDGHGVAAGVGNSAREDGDARGGSRR